MSGFSMRKLGKTDLSVSPLGIGGGGCIQSEDLLYAFDKGINYVFFSSDLHHHRYRQSADAIKQLCSQGSSVRDQVVLATVSYINDPDKLLGVILDQFEELNIDYIDVFHWGWITSDHDTVALLNAAATLQEGGQSTVQYRMHEAVVHQVKEVNESLLRRGLVRYIGMSFHSRRAALSVMQDIDVMMVKYNIARTSMEKDIFAHLTGDKKSDPGVVAFNVAHEKNAFFHTPPPGFPRDLVPSIPDCYRFALSNPWVDVVLTGMNQREQIDQAINAIENGPLSPDEYQFLREYGTIYS